MVAKLPFSIRTVSVLLSSVVEELDAELVSVDSLFLQANKDNARHAVNTRTNNVKVRVLMCFLFILPPSKNNYCVYYVYFLQ